MASPSFERFDYLLRTNKSIERKLVFDFISSAQRKFSIPDYWYLGFGSMWFGDFRIAHRVLHIDDMISIEHPQYSARAEYNKPFSSITVIGGESTEVLKAGISADLWSRPNVCWLDYDGQADDLVVDDLKEVLKKSRLNSFALATVNAARGTYRPKDNALVAGAPKTAIAVVSKILGASSIPKDYVHLLEADHRTRDVPERDFPKFLAQCMLNFMQHHLTTLARSVFDDVTKEEKKISFFPAFQLHHRDGADMVTVGGALILEELRPQWIAVSSAHTAICEAGQSRYCVMDLVPLTLKEKISLDRSLPSTLDNAAYLGRIRAEGIRLPDDEIEKYRTFYRQFPMFVETTY